MEGMQYSLCVVDDGRYNADNVVLKTRDPEFARKDDFPFVYHNFKRNSNVKKCLYFNDISTAGL